MLIEVFLNFSSLQSEFKILWRLLLLICIVISVVRKCEKVRTLPGDSFITRVPDVLVGIAEDFAFASLALFFF
jgi:hypothetical protein